MSVPFERADPGGEDSERLLGVPVPSAARPPVRDAGPVYRVVIAVALWMERVMRWTVLARGVDRIPAYGGAVVATNHLSYLDFVVAGTAALERGRVIRFLAKQEVFDNPFVRPLMRGMGHIPVDRFGAGRDALAPSVEAARSGEIVGIYPEGTINRSFVPGPGKTGAVRIAMAAGVPLVPGAVWGGQRIWTAGRKPAFRRRVPILVAFGDPVPYRADEDVAAVTARLMAAIEALVSDLVARYPVQPSSPDDRWWLPAHLGGTALSRDEALAVARADAERRRARRQRRAGTPRTTA